MLRLRLMYKIETTNNNKIFNFEHEMFIVFLDVLDFLILKYHEKIIMLIVQ